MNKRVEAIARQLVREIDPAYHYSEQKGFIEDIHYDGFMEMAARILDASYAAAWRPIESAPRDGTLVDLWVDGQREIDCHYLCGDWWKIEGDGTDKFWGHVTHWMPLPEPPESE